MFIVVKYKYNFYDVFCFYNIQDVSWEPAMHYHVRTLEQLRPLLLGLRKAAGLTQTQLAARLGVSQQSYARLEANPAAASVERLYRALRALDAELALSSPGSPPPPSAADAHGEEW